MGSTSVGGAGIGSLEGAIRVLGSIEVGTFGSVCGATGTIGSDVEETGAGSGAGAGAGVRNLERPKLCRTRNPHRSSSTEYEYSVHQLPVSRCNKNWTLAGVAQCAADPRANDEDPNEPEYTPSYSGYKPAKWANCVTKGTLGGALLAVTIACMHGDNLQV